MTMQENRYRADLRDLAFVLFEQHRIGEVLSVPPFEGWGVDEVRAVITEGYKFACEVFGPLNSSGDAEGCRLEGGQVKTPQGFAEAYRRLYEAGWKAVSVDTEWGGQGGPRTLHAVIEEFLAGANVSLSMYAGLSFGVGEIVEKFGTPDQKQKYLERVFQGVWAGTMCLTEPHAGSDVGALSSTASRNADGTFHIRGTKIFISGGDQDITENIIHAVLARIDGAPPGTKGLSLFLVPKYRIEEGGAPGQLNDVSVGRIEHKMGIKGSSTCVLNFGENDACVGELVGGVENAGMSQMFRMMNSARIAVGIQGLAIASTAYLNALDYARSRKQGSSMKHWKDATAPRVPILEHADIRRLLLDMKGRVEGVRALVHKLVMHADRAHALRGKDESLAAYHDGQVELLTPIVKAYSTDQAFRVCEWAIQVHGGAGFTADYPVEQYCRDSKIFSIYEGTNHIQSMDLVGRKLGQGGGKHMKDFLGDVGRFVAENKEHPDLAKGVILLERALASLTELTMQLMGWFGGGKVERVPLAANGFLELMAEVTVGWLLLDQARIATAALPSVADGHPDRSFYSGKKLVALQFASTQLATAPARASALVGSDAHALEIEDAAFASV